MARRAEASFDAAGTDPARWTFHGEWNRLIPQRDTRRLLEQLAAVVIPEQVIIDVRDAYLDSWGESRVEKLTDEVEAQGGKAVVLADGGEEATLQTLRRRYARRQTQIVTDEAEALKLLGRS